MLLALLDYHQYRGRKGRYSDTQLDAGMGTFAFTDCVPEEVVNDLREGDFFFTQRLDSFLSWAVMYFGSSSVDHTGICDGRGYVGHMTLAGAKMHSIRAIAKGARILFVRMNHEQMVEWSRRFEEIRPRIHKGSKFQRAFDPRFQIVMAGIYLVHGKYPDRFRTHLWVDFFVTLMIMCAMISAITGYVSVFIIPMISASTLIYYSSIRLFDKISGRAHLTISHPDIGYSNFFNVGGLMFTRLGPITVTDLGLLPLKVMLGLARKSPDDSSNDDLEEARQFFRYLVESWNIEIPTEKAEDNYTN